MNIINLTKKQIPLKTTENYTEKPNETYEIMHHIDINSKSKLQRGKPTRIITSKEVSALTIEEGLNPVTQ